MDPNWIIAIIGVITALTPSIASWLTNRYQLKLKKLELFEKRKYEAIELFTKSAEFYYHHKSSSSAIINFEASISNLFIYFSIPKYAIFDKLKECISSNEYDKTQFAISEIVKILSSQLEK